MYVKIASGWKELLGEEFEKGYFKDLVRFVKEEYASQVVYPPGKEIFACFDLCPIDQLKVVLLGQDPYHGPGQAHGLCFSVRNGIKFPPSLQNIFKERESDLGTPIPSHGDLTTWANQGVLLLNATLTVRAHQAGSHQNKGWERFTDAVIQKINQQKENVVFVLWGGYAQKKKMYIDANRHGIVASVHPSPLSAYGGFFGSKPFSKVNEYLVSQGKTPIQW